LRRKKGEMKVGIEVAADDDDGRNNNDDTIIE
jgi:hypothetical protein